MSIKNVFEDVINQEEIKDILDSLTMEKGNVETSHYYNGSIGFYNLPITNQHLDKIEKLVKSTVGDNIKFENSFTRIYKEGSVLGFHIDRPGLDITVSLCLKRDVAWPLIVSLKQADEQYSEHNQESYRLFTSNYDLLPGSMVIAEGRKFPHWREQFNGNNNQSNIYVFFHWNRV
jgi:hypothetical protein